MLETRHEFRESLKELERQTLEGLEMVIQRSTGRSNRSATRTSSSLG